MIPAGRARGAERGQTTRYARAVRTKKKRRESLRGAFGSVHGPLPAGCAGPVQQHFPAPDPYRAF